MDKAEGVMLTSRTLNIFNWDNDDGPALNCFQIPFNLFGNQSIHIKFEISLSLNLIT